MKNKLSVILFLALIIPVLGNAKDDKTLQFMKIKVNYEFGGFYHCVNAWANADSALATALDKGQGYNLQFIYTPLAYDFGFSYAGNIITLGLGPYLDINHAFSVDSDIFSVALGMEFSITFIYFRFGLGYAGFNRSLPTPASTVSPKNISGDFGHIEIGFDIPAFHNIGVHFGMSVNVYNDLWVRSGYHLGLLYSFGYTKK